VHTSKLKCVEVDMSMASNDFFTQSGKYCPYLGSTTHPVRTCMSSSYMPFSCNKSSSTYCRLGRHMAILNHSVCLSPWMPNQHPCTIKCVCEGTGQLTRQAWLWCGQGELMCLVGPFKLQPLEPLAHQQLLRPPLR
jgi:hypothetical protein